MKTEMDAWKQNHELHKRFTKEWEIRNDIRVMALACDRTVRLALAYGDEHPAFKGMPNYRYMQRNVSTMREFANAILDACEFVEKSNPVWASHGTPDV